MKKNVLEGIFTYFNPQTHYGRIYDKKDFDRYVKDMERKFKLKKEKKF